MLDAEQRRIGRKRSRGGADDPCALQQPAQFPAVPAFFHSLREQVAAVFLAAAQFVAETEEVNALLLEF